VLIDASKTEMCKVVDERIAEAIVRVREEQVKVTPGFDGVYGKLVIFEEEGEAAKPTIRRRQRRLSDFM